MNLIRQPFKLLFVALPRVGPCLLLLAALHATAPAQTWTELFPTGSPPFPLHVPKPVHYDPGSNRLIALFPGNPPFNLPAGTGNEVWVLTNANGTGGPPAWIKLQPAGTPPFANSIASVVYDASTNRLVVYGGCFANCSPALSEVFTLSHANGLGGPPVWTQSTVANPQPRVGHSAVLDPVNNLMVAFGGQFAFFGTDANDTRVLSHADGTGGPSTWTTLAAAGAPPPARDEHAAVYDPTTNRMTVFGGQKLVQCCGPYIIDNYNDTWVLSNANGLGGTPAWTQLAPTGGPPPARGSMPAVYDPAHNRMLVFGGSQWDELTQSFTLFGDLWQLSHANGTGGPPAWTQLPQSGALPGPRFWHTAAFDAAGQRMIVLGGWNLNDPPHNRVWVLSLPPSSCVEPPAGMVSWWTGDGTAGDIQGANDGTLLNGATFAPGKVGQAFSFGDLDDVVRVPHNADLNFGTGDVTVDAWMKFDDPAFTSDRVIVIKHAPTAPFPGYVFRWLGDKLQFIVDSELGGPEPNPPSVQDKKVEATLTRDTQWHHVAAVRRGLTMELYYDGALVASATHGGVETADNTGILAIGNGVSAIDNGFPGLLDEVEIFGRALSASEIQAVFNAGSFGKCRPGGGGNSAPSADAGADQTVECAGALTPVTLDGSASSDPDGDALTYTWREGANLLGTGATLNVAFTTGAHAVTLEVQDPAGATDTDTVLVNVVDTTPPTLSGLAANPSVLWPPNHAMRDVTLVYDVTDGCGGTAACVVSSVTSNEPAKGTGDGDTAPDWEVVNNRLVRLRAERSGAGAGRVYTINVTCTDAAGNTSSGAVTVVVPKSQRK